MKCTITIKDDSPQAEEGVEKVISEVTKYEDVDSGRIASELDLLERQDLEVTVTVQAKPASGK